MNQDSLDKFAELKEGEIIYSNESNVQKKEKSPKYLPILPAQKKAKPSLIKPLATTSLKNNSSPPPPTLQKIPPKSKPLLPPVSHQPVLKPHIPPIVNPVPPQTQAKKTPIPTPHYPQINTPIMPPHPPLNKPPIVNQLPPFHVPGFQSIQPPVHKPQLPTTLPAPPPLPTHQFPPTINTPSFAPPPITQSPSFPLPPSPTLPSQSFRPANTAPNLGTNKPLPSLPSIMPEPAKKPPLPKPANQLPNYSLPPSPNLPPISLPPLPSKISPAFQKSFKPPLNSVPQAPTFNLPKPLPSQPSSFNPGVSTPHFHPIPPPLRTTYSPPPALQPAPTLPSPVPVSPPPPVVEEKVLDPREEALRRKRGFLIHSVVTFLALLGTAILLGTYIAPLLRGSDNLSPQDDFDKVLINLLQVKDYTLKAELQADEIDKVLRNINNQSPQNVEDGQIKMNATFRVKNSNLTQKPILESQYQFDVSLNDNKGGRSNLSYNVSTLITEDEQSYFRINAISSIQDGQPEFDLKDRWSNLKELVTQNKESISLNYVSSLLSTYSHSHYLVILPSFLIEDGQPYNKMEKALLDSQAYKLQESSCKEPTVNRWRCKVIIDYAKLRQFYETAYDDILKDKSRPSNYLAILQTADDESSNLPKEINITFDKETQRPIALDIDNTNSRIAAAKWSIRYEDFNNPAFRITDAQDIDLLNFPTEYSPRIKEWEGI